MKKYDEINKMVIQEDNRELSYSELEGNIQNINPLKDKTFKLNGDWKVFREKFCNFEVYCVNGNWIRNNLSIMFGCGGHGMVHEFIPNNEIWVDKFHYKESGIDNLPENMLMSEEFTRSTILHEITEYILMNFGMNFWKAHNFSLEVERFVGILNDPHSEN